MAVTQRHLDASADEVFAVLGDPTTYPQWLIGAQEIRNVTPDWPAVGSAFDHRVGWGPLQIPDRTSVRRIVPSRLLELQVRARPLIEAVATFTITDDAPGCVVAVDESPSGIFTCARPLLDPLIAVRNRRSLDRLATVVERAARRPATR